MAGENSSTPPVLGAEDVKELGAALEGAKSITEPISTPPIPTPTPIDPPPPTPPTPPAAGTPPAPATPPASPKPGETPPPTPPTPPAAAAADVEDIVDLKDLFGGKFTSIEEIESRLNRVIELEQQLEEATAKPKFTSERAQMLFDYANKFDGMEMDAFKSFLHVQSLAVNDLSDQQARFEAFKLSPEVAAMKLSEKDVQELFVDNERTVYGIDPENPDAQPSNAQNIKSKAAATAAKQNLLKMQKEFGEAKPQHQTPENVAEERAKIKTNAETALKGFTGIQMPVVATGDNGEKLEGKFNFAITKPEQLQAIVEACVNPQEMWLGAMEKGGIVDKAGNVDMAKFGELTAKFLNHDEIVAEAYRQGHNDGIAYKVKTYRNPAPPAPTGAPPTPPAPKNDMEGLAQAAMGAKSGMG